MSVGMLEKLPYEILIGIADCLPAQALRSLSQVSFRCFEILAPLVYRTVTFRARSEWAINVLNIDSFLRVHRHSPISCNLCHTRKLSISAPIHFARFNRCAYHNFFRSTGLELNTGSLGTSNEALAHEHFLDDLSRQVQSVLTHLKPNGLQEFGWRLGSCIPAGLLDPNGYLCRQQQSLSHLTLVTDGSCPHAGGCVDGLSRLRRLKSLEWEGIQHTSEVATLRRCIQRNRTQLSHLALSFAVYTECFDFCYDIFELSDVEIQSPEELIPYAAPSPFPCLSSVSLSKAILPRKLRPEHLSLFSSFSSLKLRDCVNQLSFLKSLCNAQKIQLETFEFCYDSNIHRRDEYKEVQPVVDFLLSFEGLRHLHLKLANVSGTKHIKNGIQQHHSTLESLVYHERTLAAIDSEGIFEETRDDTAVWVSDLSIIANSPQTTALALCTTPSILKLKLEPFARISSLEILHFRFSGLDRLHRNVKSEFLAQFNQHRALSSGESLSSGQHVGVESLQRECYCSSPFRFEHASECDLDSPSFSLSDISETTRAFPEAEEFVEFASWAFSPSGLPKLQVLAFGDFSHGDRFSDQQFLVRRKAADRPLHNGAYQGILSNCNSNSNYCLVESKDPSAWANVRIDGPLFLSTCPESGLMESPFE